MAELKPCPFCGGSAVTGFAIWDYNYWGVTCVACGAYVPVNYGESEEKAIEAWNRRAGK
ncbi:MAG: Lar family restriction alleviation protein [Oscillospiraceae bacterium]|nr:Lar family restriction alleviation protein [Oscillospiraceae bacterium]